MHAAAACPGGGASICALDGWRPFELPDQHHGGLMLHQASTVAQAVLCWGGI